LKKFRIAIVGAGPAGYFAAQAFQKNQTSDTHYLIDMIERLPTPWGLVRSGVAPDHPKIKNISKVFEKIAQKEGFELFANIEVGRDVAVKDLQEMYDAVIIATGAGVGKKLNITGENSPNCISSLDFVSWYNGHPDFSNYDLNFNFETAVVIGAGNVALDVARILLINPHNLQFTDIAEHALEKLKLSKVKKVIICSRRGPEHVAFSGLELKEIAKLDGLDIVINPIYIQEARKRVSKSGEVDKDTEVILKTLEEISKSKAQLGKKCLEIRFLVSPVEINTQNTASKIFLTSNSIINDKIESAKNKIVISTGLVISAIGYNVAEITGLEVENGRYRNIAGHIRKNLYVTGWAKRGSIGVIGNNKSDSADVVDLIIKNLSMPKSKEGIRKLIRPQNIVINQDGWEKINATEVVSGELVGKPRNKIVNWAQLIDASKSNNI
jgi:ferredoxin--NADP+ reductase